MSGAARRPRAGRQLWAVLRRYLARRPACARDLRRRLSAAKAIASSDPSAGVLLARDEPTEHEERFAAAAGSADVLLASPSLLASSTLASAGASSPASTGKASVPASGSLGNGIPSCARTSGQSLWHSAALQVSGPRTV